MPMKFRSDESGQALIFTALCMTILLGFTGLAVDVGMLFHAKRNLQIAADAAATAAGVDYLYNGSTTSAKAAGQAAATQNGVTNGSGGASVTINTPPSVGPNAGTAGLFEAIVSTPNPTFFMRVFNRSSVTVAARAVATTIAGGPCVYLTATSGNALYLKGSYDIESPGCGWYINSPDSNAVDVTGNGGTVNAAYVDVVGNATGNHSISPTQATLNSASRTNPYGDITGPTPGSGCTTGTGGNTSTATTLTGDLTASAPGNGNAICYSNAVTLNNVTLGNGIYVFENGVNINGTVAINGGTLDVEGGLYNQPSNTTLSIIAPTSGTYNGVALLVPAVNTSYPCNTSSPTQLQLVFGSSSATLDGIIYAPCAQVYLQDNGGNVVGTGIVAGSLYDNASQITIPSYSGAHPGTSPFRIVALVE